MIAQHGVYDHKRVRIGKAADELRCQLDLLDCAAVAGDNGVKFDADFSPMRGEQPHIFCHVLHNEAGKATRVR